MQSFKVFRPHDNINLTEIGRGLSQESPNFALKNPLVRQFDGVSFPEAEFMKVLFR
jgi:hypothetical protein